MTNRKTDENRLLWSVGAAKFWTSPFLNPFSPEGAFVPPSMPGMHAMEIAQVSANMSESQISKSQLQTPIAI